VRNLIAPAEALRDHRGGTSMRRFCLLSCATLLTPLASSGCATSLSTFQPAHVAPKGHVTAEIGMDLSIPTGTVQRSIDAGKTLAAASRSRMLSEAEKIQLYTAGLNLALNPPFFVQHLGVTYTPAESWEIGLRYASQAWRLSGRHQLLRQAEDGVDLTVGVGIQRFTASFPISDVIDVLSVDDFTRWNVDVPILLGKRTDFYRFWGGPRLVVSRYDTGLTVHLPAQAGVPASDDVATVDGRGIYLGAQGGIAVGYRMLFIGAELTVVRMLGSAHLDAFGRTIDADTRTWIIYPGLALMGEF
jgi:hypothetical protein